MASTFQTRAKLGFIKGEHLASHTYKIALFTTAFAASASVNGYTATNEASATGYTAGGQTLSGYSASNASTKGILDWTTDPSWTITGTLAFQYAMIYNDSDTVVPDGAVCILDFGSQSVTNATVTIQFPTPDASNALIRIA